MQIMIPECVILLLILMWISTYSPMKGAKSFGS